MKKIIKNTEKVQLGHMPDLNGKRKILRIMIPKFPHPNGGDKGETIHETVKLICMRNACRTYHN